MDLLIVGAGAMGRWFAGVVDADIAFADVDLTAAEDAADTLGGRAVPLAGEERFDVVCLAVPMDVVTSAVESQAHRASDAIVVLSGVMRDPVAAMADHAPDR
ncbi:MAG: prephenate dehydrogenase, partial [Halobacteriales archaeon]|nr:prephenate dehydrogenase [Halobacteriales archaeon]